MGRFFTSPSASATVRLGVIAFILCGVMGFPGFAYAAEPGELVDVPLSGEGASLDGQVPASTSEAPDVADVPDAASIPGQQYDTQGVAVGSEQITEMTNEDMPPNGPSDVEEEPAGDEALTDDTTEEGIASSAGQIEADGVDFAAVRIPRRGIVQIFDISFIARCLGIHSAADIDGDMSLVAANHDVSGL